MKKRIFLSILLTVCAMAVMYQLWQNTSVLVFISILILSFLLSYKISDYIAEFKTVKQNSTADIAFLLIFFVILCIPASHITNTKKSENENRYLAEKTTFINKNKLNFNYGKEFNEWFNDRFNLRNDAIKTDTVIKCVINKKNCKLGEITFDKKHNLIYRENFWGMKPIKDNKNDVLKMYVENISKFGKYCSDKNIGLYILIVPRQADYFDFDMPDKRKNEQNPADEVIEYISDNTNVKIIYPKEEMKLANKETPVFFKTDHHWTKKGAYTGYSELIKEIQKDYSDVKLLDDNKLEQYYDKRVSEWWDKNFNPGKTYRHMKLPKFYAPKVLDTQYLYYKNPEFKNLKKENSEFTISARDVQFRYPNGAKERILVIGDSFGCNLFEFMPYSFKESLYIYNNPRGFTIETYKPVIEKYNPDIIVVLFYTPNIPKFLDLYDNKYRNVKKGE